MNNPRLNLSTTRNTQKGLATILMVLLIGFSITALSLGVMFAVRGSQENQITAQAQVNAQAAAWAGAENLRLYLSKITTDDLLAITDNTAGNVLSAGDASVTATVLNRESVTANPAAPYTKMRVKLVAVVGQDPAKASSALELVYAIYPGQGGVTELNGSTFIDGVAFGGTTTVIPGANTNGLGETLSVKGDFIGTAALVGVNTLRVEGDVTLQGNNNDLQEVHSNGDITLDAASKIRIAARAVGKIITASADCLIGSAFANDNITLKCKSPLGSSKVHSQKNIVVESDAAIPYPDVLAGETVNIKGTGVCGSTPCFAKVAAKQDVTFGGSPSVGSVKSQKIINCASGNITGFISLLSAGGAVAPEFNTNCKNGAAQLNATKFSVASPLVDSAPLVPAVAVSGPNINVWNYFDDANYIFTSRGDGVVLVTTKNLKKPNGTVIEDKTYLLAEGKYLCPSDGSTCDNNLRIVYEGGITVAVVNGKPDKFQIQGYTVPGVMFFQGDLHNKGVDGSSLNYGISATILATGDISTGGNTHMVAALNFAGKSGQPADTLGTNFNSGAVHGVCEQLAIPTQADGIIPSNLCVDGAYKGTPLGNIAYMSGGKKPRATPTDSEGPYTGGNIQLAASSKTFGTVLAGNLLDTGGTTWIKGLVSASAQALNMHIGSVALVKNNIGADTRFDYSDLPAGYNPNLVPTRGGAVGTAGAATQLLGAKYL